MDPILCCLLGICCPPGSAEQREVLLNLLAAQLGDAELARVVCEEQFEEFAKATEKLAHAVKKASKQKDDE